VRRRTQAERRAKTRERLLDAARKAFACRGFQATSMDYVSELAGCTKGAVYDHFKSKDGLFLALLDHQFALRLEQADHVAGSPSASMPFDRDFSLLFLEFVCAAARNRKLRAKLADRMRALRSKSAERLGDERIAAVAGAMANGAGIEALVFGEQEGSATFDAGVGWLLEATKRMELGGFEPPTS